MVHQMLRKALGKAKRRSGRDDAATSQPESHPSASPHSVHTKLRYPPSFSRGWLYALQNSIKDYQITHGSLVKLVRTDENDAHTVLSRPIGVSMFPTLFPRSLFDLALELQNDYNVLYATIAEDEAWLREAQRELICRDEFARKLWSIHQRVKNEGGYVQPVTLGIWRSDYMLHCPSGAIQTGADLQLKQVEFNAYSVAGGLHGNIVSNMHRHLARTGAYTTEEGAYNFISLSSCRPNRTVESLIAGLTAAHAAYGEAKDASAAGTAVLFVVQPENVNICDERPLEYGLWDNNDPSVPAYRVEWQDVMAHTRLTPSRHLLFFPPHASQPVEVSVVYMRAGYDAEEYDDMGLAVRLQLEKSAAIKCPSVLAHLSTFKKVQQELAAPGSLEHFLSAECAARIKSTFVPMYPLDGSETGKLARELALNPTTAKAHVLKPSREGGGHNVYGPDIPRFLKSIPESQWASYILMELIKPPPLHNILLSSRGTYEGRVVSELGVFGTCLWRNDGPNKRPQMIESFPSGWSFKSKAEDVNEMSVIKGYGCFDSPCLINDWQEWISKVGSAS